MTLEVGNIRSVAKNYGDRKTDQKYGGRVANDLIKTAVWTFSYDALPVASTNKLTYSIPANAVILEAYFLVQTAFTGGTSYDIDLVTSADAAIGTGKDKLWDALILAEIDSSVVGTAVLSSTHTGTNSGNVLAGFAAGAEYKLSSAGQLSVVATGTFTAGVAQIVVQYMDLAALPAT
jgi:hypothetical protein